MSGYDAEQFEAAAIEGDWKAAISVLSRSTVKPEVLSALMSDDAHDEIRIALALRSDVTPQQLVWCAECDSPFILNRLVSHPRTPLPTVKDIRDRSEGRPEETWAMLNKYAKRTAERRVREAGGLHGGL
jgi:hypothetical protein